MKQLIRHAMWLVIGLYMGAMSPAMAQIVDPSGVLVDQGAITLDTASWRQWLDLSQTTGRSYNQMKADYGCDPTCVSGPYAGWTFAQAGDVRGLVEDAGLPYAVDLDLSSASDRDKVILLTLLLGGDVFIDDAGCSSGCGGVLGLLNRILTASDLASGVLVANYPPDIYAGFVQQASLGIVSCCGDIWTGDNLAGPAGQVSYVAPIPADAAAVSSDAFFTAGVWLYRLPEPPTLLLFATAIGPWLIIRRRRNG